MARLWIVLGILAMVLVMSAVVVGFVMFVRGPEMRSVAYTLQGSPLQIRLELKQRSFLDQTVDRTVRSSLRERQRQADLRPDPGGFARVNLYRQADRVVVVGWGGTVSISVSTGDLEVIPGPVLPESVVGYLGAFDLEEGRRLRFFPAAECPFVAIATATGRPRSCKP